MDEKDITNMIEPDSLYHILNEYGNSDFYPYHMPGHKRQEFDFLPKEFASIDITEIDGFDNLHNPEGIIKEAEDYCASVCGADKSFFLVNGSTCGVLAAISSAVPKHGKLIIARNAHKSAYYAMTIRDIDPVYIYPEINERFGICEAVSPWAIQEALNQNPEASAVFVVSPTYEGRLADIKKIAQIVHECGKILIVDEAHGAHLSYASGIYGYGSDACRAGADIVIQSTHKTIPAPTQTSLLHVNGNRVDLEKLKQFLHIFMTSSPSYPLMAGIDGAVRLMAKDGERLLINLRNRFSRMVDDLSNCKYIEVLPYTEGQDVGKLVISASAAKMTGKQLSDLLRKDYHLELEEAGEKYALAMFTVADTDEGFDRLKRALLEIDESIFMPDEDFLKAKTDAKHDSHINIEETDNYLYENEIVYSLSDSFEMPKKWVNIEASEGLCVGEYINLYPPGTPILAPGERITRRHINQIKKYLEDNLQIVGLTEGRMSVLDT